MSKGYRYHYHKARTEFIEWFFKNHPEQEMIDLRNVMVDDEDMIGFDDEFKWALESFDDARQVKILWHYELGEHVLKIKWEHSPWWVGQRMHFYYCVMLPLDNVEFKTPYQLAVGEEE